MINLRDEMIVPQFGEYKYVHEVGSNPEFFIELVISLLHLRKN